MKAEKESEETNTRYQYENQKAKAGNWQKSANRKEHIAIISNMWKDWKNEKENENI